MRLSRITHLYVYLNIYCIAINISMTQISRSFYLQNSKTDLTLAISPKPSIFSHPSCLCKLHAKTSSCHRGLPYRKGEALDGETASHLDPTIKIIKFGKFLVAGVGKQWVFGVLYKTKRTHGVSRALKISYRKNKRMKGEATTGGSERGK